MNAQEKFARILLQQVRNEHYPSRTHMAIFEASAPPEMREEYLDVLLEKVARDRRPSIPMLRHIQRLVAG